MSDIHRTLPNDLNHMDDVESLTYPFLFSAELCTTVEAIYSHSYNYHALGHIRFGDLAEAAAFNALPAAMTPNAWGHQYISTPNQPFSGDLNIGKTPWWNVGPRGPMFGVEPNYPCCAVNHPQGWPKFVSHSWGYYGENGLAHLLHGPTEINTTLPNGNRVRIKVTTNYPFSDVVSYELMSNAKPFDLFIRIPAWGNDPLSTIMHGVFDENTGLMRLRMSGDGRYSSNTMVTIKLSTSERIGRELAVSRMPLRIVNRPEGAISILRGPLLYTLDLAEQAESSPPRYWNSKDTIRRAPEQAKDWKFQAQAKWNIAVDPKTLRDNSTEDPDEILGEQVWARGSPPTYLEIKGCEIDWPMSNGLPGPPPRNPTCVGPRNWYRLVPYGSVRIGMAELPILPPEG